jgi:hypothetical protein
MSARINMAAIRQKAMATAKFARAAQGQAKLRFDRAKAELMQDFLSDIVTNEIRGGNTVSNSSGTLGGYGNLFSYIGFYEDFDAIAPVQQYLKQFAFSSTVSNTGRGILTLKVKWPSINEIEAITPMPWEEGNSWVTGIERGISGFGHYMYNLAAGKGRSGAAIQKKNPTGIVASFSTRRYLPTMLTDAKRRLKKR